jgi:hypothetical protein
MTTNEKKFIHDLIAELLGLAKNKVVWVYPNAPQPARPFATLQLFAQRGEAQEDIIPTASVGVYDVVVPETQTLSVQLYDTKGGDVCSKLDTLARRLETPTVADKCFAAGVAFYDAESVIDLTDAVDDANAMPRANIDLFVRTNSVITDDLSVIEETDANAKYKYGDDVALEDNLVMGV